MSCDQEMCPMWDGDGCPCDLFGLERDDLSTGGIYTFGPCSTRRERST